MVGILKSALLEEHFVEGALRLRSAPWRGVAEGEDGSLEALKPPQAGMLLKAEEGRSSRPKGTLHYALLQTIVH